MKTKLIILLSSILLITSLTSCQTFQQPTQQGYEGATAGALLGGISGALIGGNRWRGGLIGAVLGGAAGYTLSQIQSQAAQQSAYYDQPSQYQTTTNNGIQGTVQAEPIGYDPQTGCKTVRIKTWQDGQLISNIVKQVCPAQ